MQYAERFSLKCITWHFPIVNSIFCFIIQSLSNARLFRSSLLSPVALTGRSFSVESPYADSLFHLWFLLLKSHFTKESTIPLQLADYCCRPNRSLVIDVPFFSSWGWTNELSLTPVAGNEIGLPLLYKRYAVLCWPPAAVFISTYQSTCKDGGVSMSPGDSQGNWYPF